MRVSNAISAVRRIAAMAFLGIGAMAMFVIDMADAEAVPAFARKYQANCVLCHNNQPRLNTFGQQFKENGYQMPGSADGSTTAKRVFEGGQGPVALDDISNMMAVRIRADIQQPAFRQETDDMKAEGVREQVEFTTPKIVNLFFTGTARENLSYLLEAEYNTQEHGATLKFERAFLIFDNLGGQSVANVQVGVFDPSGLYAFPTHRQQLNPIAPKAETEGFPPDINRVPLVPLAFSSKMFGLTKGAAFDGAEGFSVLPFEPYLYNAPFQTGISVHGRPGGFGSGFMYQLGVAVNDKAFGGSPAVLEKESRYDRYVMGRYDWMTSGGTALQVAAFYYQAPDAAVSTLNMAGILVYADSPTDIDRWGIGGRAQFGSWDIYGTYIADSIDKPTFASAMANTSTWETDAAGVSLEADWRFHQKWMLGLRYDRMTTAGLSKLPPMVDPAQTKLNVDAQFIAPIIKYYPSPNIGLYARAHMNLESSTALPNAGSFDGSEHPATNLKSMLALGVDMTF